MQSGFKALFNRDDNAKQPIFLPNNIDKFCVRMTRYAE